jgi:hypothetical protein
MINSVCPVSRDTHAYLEARDAEERLDSKADEIFDELTPAEAYDLIDDITPKSAIEVLQALCIWLTANQESKPAAEAAFRKVIRESIQPALLVKAQNALSDFDG